MNIIFGVMPLDSPGDLRSIPLEMVRFYLDRPQDARETMPARVISAYEPKQNLSSQAPA